MAASPSPARFLTSKQGVKEGKAKPLVVSDPVTSWPLGPGFLHLVMEQCGLWLNEQGGLVPTNPNKPSISPSATMGFRVLRALPTDLDLGVARELHCTLVTWLRGERQEAGRLVPMVAAAFSLSPSLRVNLFSPSPSVTHAKLSILLGAKRSKSPRYF